MPTGIEPNIILLLQSLSHDPGISGTFQPLDTELCPNHEAFLPQACVSHSSCLKPCFKLPTLHSLLDVCVSVVVPAFNTILILFNRCFHKQSAVALKFTCNLYLSHFKIRNCMRVNLTSHMSQLGKFMLAFK